MARGSTGSRGRQLWAAQRPSGDEPARGGQDEYRALLVEEYRLCGEDRRFYVVRYMQVITIYLVFFGYSLKLLIEAGSRLNVVALGIFIELITILALTAAVNFKKLVYHSLRREAVLARGLGFQEPHSLMFGFHIPLVALVLAVIVVVFLSAVLYIHTTSLTVVE